MDVGANDPDILSNTKLFYNKGWHGINIEPTPHLYTKLCTKRDRDINLGVGVGPKPGLMTFYRMSADILSSFNKEAAIKGGELYGATLVSEDPTQVLKLADIIEDNLQGTEIDFLSVDAEGYDLAVLKSNDWFRYQPSVIIVEINVEGNEIIAFLQQHNYTLIFDNGTNGIFVSRKFLVTIDDRVHADLARLGRKHNLETFFPCSDDRDNLVVNFVNGHRRQKDNGAVHNGSISIIWSTLPVEGCDVYVYHNAFSYRGKKGGIDFLLMLEPVVVLPGEFDESVWKHFDHIFGLFDAPAAQSGKYHKILFPRAADIPGIPEKHPVTDIQSRRESLYPVSGRKNAICMISGNKKSHVPSELYSKRVEAAQWFYKKSKIPFDVFGRPPFALPNYRGAIPDDEKLSV
ncbi:MAG: FkbM family methyltransferase, partial [Chloroflexota bacterium]|nr:FkbM family methyltransferase [Chloroflexota bacterium]